MSDELLRRLERDVAVGDPIARSRLLAERIRTGHVPLEGVRLAAYAGDMAARDFLGRKAPVAPKSNRAFAVGLERFGKANAVRAAIAASSIFLPLWRSLGAEWPVGVIESAGAWLECPCEQHRRAASAAMTAGKARGVEVVYFLAEPALETARAASRLDRGERERPRAARLAAKDAADAAGRVAIWCKPELIEFWVGLHPEWSQRARDAVQASGIDKVDDATVRAAMERALCATALAGLAAG